MLIWFSLIEFNGLPDLPSTFFHFYRLYYSYCIAVTSDLLVACLRISGNSLFCGRLTIIWLAIGVNRSNSRYSSEILDASGESGMLSSSLILSNFWYFSSSSCWFAILPFEDSEGYAMAFEALLSFKSSVILVRSKFVMNF